MTSLCEFCVKPEFKSNPEYDNFCYCGGEGFWINGMRSECDKLVWLDGVFVDPKGKFDGKHDNYKSFMARRAEINYLENWWNELSDEKQMSAILEVEAKPLCDWKKTEIKKMKTTVKKKLKFNIKK
tara:strand:- start:41 stop:418 length:378 start_codon:yes stop_codon:yes gene_type:complete